MSFSKTGPSSREIVLAALALGCLSVAIYGRVVENEYAFDALYTVRDNPLVDADTPISRIFSSSYWDAEAFEGRGLYRPLAVLSFQLTRRVWDDPVAVDHALDLGLHGLCCLALFAFLMQMGARFGVASALSIVFLIHPVQTEVIASLVGRGDLLATLFALFALNVCLSRRISGIALWIALWVLFSLSLLAKESTVALVVVLPACWTARALWQGRSTAEVLRGAVPMALALGVGLACHLALRQAVLGELLVSDTAKVAGGATGFLGLRWRALAFGSLYAQKLLWPNPLLPDYLSGVVPVDGLLLHARAFITVLMFFASLAWPMWVWRQGRSLSRVHLGMLLFWIAAAPVSNVFIQIGTPFGERLVYFPFVFLLLAAVDLPLWRPMAVAGLGEGPRFWPAWAAMLVAAAVVSAMRVPEWKDNLSLFRAAVRDCPGNYYSQMSYGVTLMEGEVEPEEHSLAIEAFLAAARNDREAYIPWAMLGTIAYADADYSNARTYFEQAKARARFDQREQAVINLSRTYRALGESGSVEKLLVPIALAQPEWVEVQRELGNHWLARGHISEALTAFERGLTRAPRDRDLWRQVIWANLYLDRTEEARERLEASPPGTLTHDFEVRLKNAGLALPK